MWLLRLKRSLATVAKENISHDASISEKVKNVMKNICTKFHAFMTKCTIVPIYATYLLDYQGQNRQH